MTRPRPPEVNKCKTSCASGDTIYPRPSHPMHVGTTARRAAPSRRSVAVVAHAQYVLTVTAASAWRVKARWVKPPGDLDLWPFDLESGVRVTCDVGYLCANFVLPRPLCSLLRPDVRDRQTSDWMSDRQTSDVRQKHLLIHPPIISERHCWFYSSDVPSIEWWGGVVWDAVIRLTMTI